MKQLPRAARISPVAGPLRNSPAEIKHSCLPIEFVICWNDWQLAVASMRWQLPPHLFQFPFPFALLGRQVFRNLVGKLIRFSLYPVNR